jgi:2-polyprenyl-3-methyl-5-hydroxy-6-metoxy-1,4-benzoquinol methylase
VPFVTPKYRFKEFKYNSHYWVLSLIYRRKAPLSILDVGAAEGYLGALLKRQGHSLVGVERDCAAVARARPYYETIHSVDIEEFDFPYRDHFDIVLLADVLEHLRRPEEILRRCRPCLKRDGQIIVSVPNVANVIIRMSLLLGYFKYTERGILDRTHLRFYTRSTLQRLIENCGYRIVEIKPTPIPLQLVLPVTSSRFFAPLHELHYFCTQAWQSLMAYQFVIAAVPTARNSI